MIDHRVSERRACRVVNLSRSLRRYQLRSPDDEAIIQVLKQLADQHPRWGFHKMGAWLRNQGHSWNHKHVYRVYCAMKLNLHISKRKRLPKRFPTPLAEPDAMNVCWSMDFMSDALLNGPRIRALNIIDDFNRKHWRLRWIRPYLPNTSFTFWISLRIGVATPNVFALITDPSLSHRR